MTFCAANSEVGYAGVGGCCLRASISARLSSCEVAGLATAWG